MQIITIYDFLLLPVYLFIFFILVRKKTLSLETADMKRYYLTAFFLRMLGSVAYSLMVQYYYGYGDTFTYYTGSDFIHSGIVKNINNIRYLFAPATELQQWYNLEDGNIAMSGYMAIPSNNTVMKIGALVSFISFNKFVIMSLFFGLFSFVGQWKLFEVFNDYNKGRLQKLMAVAVLYTPSIWFWGSGLMKDSLCLGATGFIISTLYNSFIKKQINARDWLLLPLFFFLLYIVKSYILAVIMAGLIFTFFIRYVLFVKNILLRIIIIIGFTGAVSLILYFANFSSAINDIVEDSYSQIQTFSQNYQNLQAEDERSMGSVQLENIDASLTGILAKSPVAIFTCLYRPFLWESKKLIIFLTSLESTFLLLSTIFLLFKSKFIGFFNICFSNGLILFSLTVSILFALIIGFTTFNFGTMIRYKIILLPFYYFMLVAILTKLQEKQALQAAASKS